MGTDPRSHECWLVPRAPSDPGRLSADWLPWRSEALSVDEKAQESRKRVWKSENTKRLGHQICYRVCVPGCCAPSSPKSQVLPFVQPARRPEPASLAPRQCEDTWQSGGRKRQYHSMQITMSMLRCPLVQLVRTCPRLHLASWAARGGRLQLGLPLAGFASETETVWSRQSETRVPTEPASARAAAWGECFQGKQEGNEWGCLLVREGPTGKDSARCRRFQVLQILHCAPCGWSPLSSSTSERESFTSNGMSFGYKHPTTSSSSWPRSLQIKLGHRPGVSSSAALSPCCSSARSPGRIRVLCRDKRKTMACYYRHQSQPHNKNCV